MQIDILTLFPESVGRFLGESIIGRAQNKGVIAIRTHQIRDFTQNKQKQVDDYPYGGGHGLIMQADPLYRCWEHVTATHGEGRTVYLSPQGRVFSQDEARRLLATPHLILVCGHYEGVDERFIEECVDEEISIGDYVITGGDLAACVVADAVCRMVPGVLAAEEGFTGESHWDGLLEYPQYSRPEVWHGKAVPEVLLSGHHANVAKWRREQALERTRRKRPDLRLPDA
ncbi:MAG: tRNA (guanosine(37)-N1)-methyltransferase TrmD [Oscillospiraceae bacterium]|nr:tRNA (guanosine(37)-N1)-methyltransferase TrmD [Oscillospiraceae bacterium]